MLNSLHASKILVIFVEPCFSHRLQSVKFEHLFMVEQKLQLNHVNLLSDLFIFLELILYIINPENFTAAELVLCWYDV